MCPTNAQSATKESQQEVNQENDVSIIIPEKTWEKIQKYRLDLISNLRKPVKDQDKTKPGKFFREHLAKRQIPCTARSLQNMSPEDFFKLLMDSRKQKFLAESGYKCDGNIDWNADEAAILSDVSIAIDKLEIYDNGNRDPKKAVNHTEPMESNILYVSAPLLYNVDEKIREKLPDFLEIVKIEKGKYKIDAEKYREVLERRLLPLLLHANESAGKERKKALITTSGLGCGAFIGNMGENIGPYGKIGALFRDTLIEILDKHHEKLPNIGRVYFDSYDECECEEKTVRHIDFGVGKSADDNTHSPQQFDLPEKHGPKYTNEHYKHITVVAGDFGAGNPPGNEFFTHKDLIGKKGTDESTKIASSNLLQKLLGVAGYWHADLHRFLPVSKENKVPLEKSWAEITDENSFSLASVNQIYKQSDNKLEEVADDIVFKSVNITLPVSPGVRACIGEQVYKILPDENPGMPKAQERKIANVQVGFADEGKIDSMYLQINFENANDAKWFQAALSNAGYANSEIEEKEKTINTPEGKKTHVASVKIKGMLGQHRNVRFLAK